MCTGEGLVQGIRDEGKNRKLWRIRIGTYKTERIHQCSSLRIIFGVRPLGTLYTYQPSKYPVEANNVADDLSVSFEEEKETAVEAADTR
jgi:hypothetical protein